ncbi:MAG: hypothetical protein LBV54_02940, partial [Puniceicoccales bacterium]|nr:hypothetical protein [Puniceicoccales bacterium]
RLKETDIRVLAGVAEDTQAKTPGGVALAPPEKPAPGGIGGRPDFEKLEDIVAAGGVRITSQARQISGNISRYDQATQTFTTSGNTRVDDFAQRVNVQGGRIVNNTTTGKIDVFRHEDGVPVVLQTPSFLRGEGKGGQGGGAIVTGGHLIISSPEEAINLIEMTGDVRAKDEGLIINSEKITVETPRGSVSKFTAPGDSGQADARVNRIFAEKDVRAIHEGRLLNCGKVEILPGQGEGEYDMELYENPVLSGRGAQLLGHRIKMHSSKVEGSEAQLSATVESAPGVAPERQRARVTLPPLNPLRSGQDAVPDDPLEQAPTVVDSDVLVMTELPGDLAEFNFTGNVVLLGTGLDGRCDRMDILADAKGDTNGSTSMARIHNITAVGNARFETEAYIARGGEAVLLPSVALRESSAPGGNGGKNGGATQFFTLKPHASTPGVRPHLTFKKASGVDFGGFPGAPSSDTSALKEQAGPIDMESDLLEILGDSVRSRFFMRGDVALSGPGMNGRCANVEGYIAQGGTSAATRSGARPGYDITRIIGREDVRFDVNGRKASGQMFEMFPQKHELYLSGNPVVNTGGITATGGERIRYNWLTKQWDMDAGSRAGAGVSRPVIIIPRRGSNWSSPRK